MRRYWTILLTTTIVSSIINQCAQIHLIGSGIQILPADKPLSEKWANHPQSRYRLFRLLKQKQTPGVIFLSGDVHYAEKMKVDVNCSDLGYPVYEFTSSGLTHSCDANVPNCNFFINKFFKHMYHLEHFFAKRNFGSIDIDWDASPATITVQAHDAVNGSVVWQEKIRLSDLTFRSNEDPNETLKIQQCEINVPKYYILPMFGIYAIVLKVVASILILILFIGTVRSLLRSRKEGRKQKKE
jgi:alkaline phosphatase D